MSNPSDSCTCGNRLACQYCREEAHWEAVWRARGYGKYVPPPRPQIGSTMVAFDLKVCPHVTRVEHGRMVELDRVKVSHFTGHQGGTLN